MSASKLYAAIVAVVVTIGAAPAAAEPSLRGQWRSDRERTMAYAEQHARLEDKTQRFLGQMMGRMTLRFDGSHVTAQMPEWTSENAQGATSTLAGFREKRRYRVIGRTADRVAVAAVEPVTRRRVITLYHFDDADTMWTYVGGSSAAPQLNIREYFVRVK